MNQFFVLILGPPAVGKMTVGNALALKTGLKMLHNHVSLEVAYQIFDWGTPAFNKINEMIRFGIFKEVANSDLKGLIFTLVMDYDEPEDLAYLEEILTIFRQKNFNCCLVELNATLEERRKRNKMPDRLAVKMSKRDLEWSETSMLKMEEIHRMTLNKGDLPELEVLKIDNSSIHATEVADLIMDHYTIPPIEPLT